MAENSVYFRVPDGFRLRCLEETAPLDDAAALLSTRRQRRYTSARRQGERCRLTRHVVVCPCCGRNTPAYEDYLYPSDREGEARVPAEQIWTWSVNLSLFPEEDELTFHVPRKETRFTCPHCSMTSREYAGDREAVVCWEKDRVSLTVFDCPPRELSACLVQAAAEGYRPRLPLKETAVFALGKGRAFLTVSDGAGRPLKIRDVSEPNSHWKSSLVCELLSASAAARRKLAQAFAAAGGAPLPFTRAELTPDRFLDLCRFRGFAREFYDALPLNRDGVLDRSFRTAARRLRDARRLPRLYREAGLPDKKSIRRIFFQTRPQLFWYCREAAGLWGLLKDVNVFRSLLDKGTAQEVLTFLHLYPAALVFFRDYAARKGGRALVQLLADRRGLAGVLFCAVRYAAGSETCRRNERRLWDERRELSAAAARGFDLPVSFRTETRDMEVGGIRFLWLRNRAAFVRAGRALGNCLAEYQPGENRVAVAWQGDQPAAAIEVSPRGMILQALGPCNEPLDRRGRVFRALSAWAERCRFRIPEPPYAGDPDEEEELPF